MRGESWSRERVEMLRKLWSEGETAAVIADRLGVMSRSAVLGKIFRLRLPLAGAGAANQKSAVSGEPGESIVAPARRRRSAAHQSAKPLAAKTTQRKTLLELTNTTCPLSLRAAAADGDLIQRVPDGAALLSLQ